MMPVVRALVCAHEQGIVHRDLKPDNVFVTDSGTVKVLDFGIAKAARRLSTTRTGTLKGKIQYLSPEQCTADPVDRRSDVFAIGILLWELTVGRRLYAGKSDLMIMKAITERDAPRPSTLVPDYPAELEALVTQALQRRPAKPRPLPRSRDVTCPACGRPYRVATARGDFCCLACFGRGAAAGR